MVNKEKALDYVDQTRNAINNLKSSAYRNSSIEELDKRFEKVEDLIEKLEMLISAEPGYALGRNYNGL